MKLRQLGRGVGVEERLRVVEAHAWARATPEGLERAYLYVGESAETVVNHGRPTAHETSLQFSFFDETRHEAQHDDYWERDDLTYPHEDDVMRLASRWSIDPSTRADRNIEVPDGLVGHLGEPKPIATAPVPPKPAKAWWQLW